MIQIIELQTEIENLGYEVSNKECDILKGKQSSQAEILNLKEKINDLGFNLRASKEQHDAEAEKFEKDIKLVIKEKEEMQVNFNKK